MQRGPLTTRHTGILAILACAAAALAFQVQLNTELYGRGVGTIQRAGLAGMPNRPWHQAALPSDIRHDMFLSGRLQSEIRGHAMQKGPLAPGGMASYVPSSVGPFGPMSPQGTLPRYPSSGGVAAAPSVPGVRPPLVRAPAPMPRTAGPTPGRVEGTVLDPRISGARPRGEFDAYPTGGSMRYEVPRLEQPLRLPGGAPAGDVTPSADVKAPLIDASRGSLRHADVSSAPGGLIIPPPVAPATRPADQAP